MTLNDSVQGFAVLIYSKEHSQNLPTRPRTVLRVFRVIMFAKTKKNYIIYTSGSMKAVNKEKIK